MTNLTSFDRDMSWVDGNVTALAWPAVGSFSAPVVQSAAAVNPKYGFAKANSNTAVAAGSTRSIGAIMRSPVEEALVYRLKGVGICQDASARFCFGYGYLPDPVGTAPFTLENPVYFQTRNECDEVVCLRPQLSGDTYEGRDVCFFVSAWNIGSSVATSAQLFVQLVSVAPDAFAIAVR